LVDYQLINIDLKYKSQLLLCAVAGFFD